MFTPAFLMNVLLVVNVADMSEMRGEMVVFVWGAGVWMPAVEQCGLQPQQVL